ncbi:MAG: hypothetical protein Q7S29_06000 [Candidatus Peribacter sp.]|nr:hypothetical protein [Candidatus Peribacter sp.]
MRHDTEDQGDQDGRKMLPTVFLREETNQRLQELGHCGMSPYT